MERKRVTVCIGEAWGCVQRTPNRQVRETNRIPVSRRSSGAISRFCLVTCFRNFFRRLITSPFQLGGIRIGAVQPRMESLCKPQI